MPAADSVLFLLAFVLQVSMANAIGHQFNIYLFILTRLFSHEFKNAKDRKLCLMKTSFSNSVSANRLP